MILLQESVNSLTMDMLKIYTTIGLLCIALLFFVAYKEQCSSVYTIARVYAVRVCVFSILLMIDNMVWKCFDLGVKDMTEDMQMLINAFYFIFDVMIYYNLVLYFDYSCGKIYKKKEKFLLFLPFGFTILLHILNLKYRFLYTVVEVDGLLDYRRAQYYFLGNILPYGIVVVNALIRLSNYLKAKISTGKADSKNTLSILILSSSICIASIKNVDFDPVPIYVIVLAVGFFLYYFHEVEFQVSLDPLTKLMNRREFNFNLDRLIANYKAYEKNKIYLIMIDINDFKEINDKYGHDAGDEVLSNIAEEMKKTLGKNRDNKSYIYRFGGDEFSIILLCEGEEEIKALLKKLNERMGNIKYSDESKLNVSLSYGFYAYESWMQKNDLINAADNELYKNKRKYHAMKDSNAGKKIILKSKELKFNT
ncbi:diguanylate cyclase (GGDEF) domain-containing protein [Acetitomaculum ruminis DSM 5522]|uniref:Diguanylate cyclase (GGDEF) domain-containing protein n=1 Tax=Acetitomaculum ruminis DSM 5522 TaxID=1120918 RepID=A0A1I0WKZ2_9FIRM|nr:GGDEF domain-containing protein [Acetitomaculum ruminis]SFA89412.1 diguanylate cyclase (GGDEF) domain-containing protein [Acetitomaculum ruminis DSM 5522]